MTSGAVWSQGWSEREGARLTELMHDPHPPLAHLTVSADAEESSFYSLGLLFCFVSICFGVVTVYTRNLIGTLISMYYFYNQKNPIYFLKLDTPPNKK